MSYRGTKDLISLMKVGERIHVNIDDATKLDSGIFSKHPKDPHVVEMHKTLYAFTKDYNGQNNFTKNDFSNNGSWPIYTSDLGAIPSSLNADDFGSFNVFGMTQMTYKGWPLYYFVQDTDRGQTKGVTVGILKGHNK